MDAAQPIQHATTRNREIEGDNDSSSPIAIRSTDHLEKEATSVSPRGKRKLIRWAGLIARPHLTDCIVAIITQNDPCVCLSVGHDERPIVGPETKSRRSALGLRSTGYFITRLF